MATARGLGLACRVHGHFPDRALEQLMALDGTDEIVHATTGSWQENQTAVDANNVYFIDDDFFDTGTLDRTTLDGTAVETLVSTEGIAAFVLAGDAVVFYENSGETFRSIPKAGGTPTLVLTPSESPGTNPALASTDRYLYFTTPTGVWRVGLDGSNPVRLLTTSGVVGFIEADAAFPESIGAKPKVEVSVPVRQIKSGKKAMDTRMLSEMNQPVHPKIEYRVLELKPKGSPSGGKAEFDAVGALTVVGVTRTNTMPVTITRVDKTKLKVNGATIVKMTDHGLKPPAFDVLGVGLMKTEDDVKITLEWTPEVEKK